MLLQGHVEHGNKWETLAQLVGGRCTCTLRHPSSRLPSTRPTRPPLLVLWLKPTTFKYACYTHSLAINANLMLDDLHCTSLNIV